MIILTYNLKYDSKYIDNILKNIHYVLDFYDIDLLLFQEATIYKKLIKIIDKDKYNHIINKSDKEHMITFYKKSYILEDSIKSHFKEGRPFIILLLKNALTNKSFYLINIHACHSKDTEIALIKPIEDEINKLQNNIKHMIIGGDFNRDILNQYEIKDYKLKNVKNKLFTCNYKYKYNYDHVISTKKPIKKITIDKYKPASDHLLTLVELQNI